mgnify:CR=1 FL=1
MEHLASGELIADAQRSIDAGFVEAGCNGALHVLDLRTGYEVAVHADRPVVLASVFKIFVALEVYAKVAEGLLDPAQHYELKPGALTAGPTGASAFVDPARVSLRDLCLMMLSVSDNAASDILLAQVGIEAVNARLAACGCNSSHVEADLRTTFDQLAIDLGFEDYAQLAAARSGALGPEAMAASHDARRIDASRAFDAKRTNRSTPRDITRLLRAVWNDEAAPAQACAALRAAMSQQVSTRLGRELPDGATLAAKTGSLTGRIRNEVGVITHVDGRAFAVAVFTHAHAPFRRVSAIEIEMAKGAASAISALRSLS